MSTTELPIAECFYSIQGEGRYAGKPAVFLRLAHCNLQCGAVGRDIEDVNPQEDEPVKGASWVCDTIDVWREPDNVYSPQELYEEFRARGWVESLASQNAHLILTGGEPTLPASQKAFTEFYAEFAHQTGKTPFVEVETNGTIKPKPEFDSTVNQYNISLKLANSGHDESDRINPEALDHYDRTYRKDFKFVVSSPADLNEIDKIIEDYNIDERDIMLMPAGQTREQLEKTYPVVAEMVKDRKWRFSPREHVSIWDKQTGV